MPLSFALDQQRVAFRQHLDEPRNQRIIFSGAFGVGKTHFLGDYFTHHAAEYVAVKLSPVNYSVSANEDIFRLIKYDVLFELLATHQLPLETVTISREVAYGVALQNKMPAILNGMVGMAPLLNKGTAELAAVWATVSAALAPFHKETEAARKDPNQLGRLVEFGKEMDKLPALEQDFITAFIEQSLDRLATSGEAPREKVLVIDDLDRIDPEHIFRLFNVFSAHLDYHKSTSNKFGFDKVVFVCDIQNIRNIFHSRYGADTDFTGYIDKFYSQEVYHFDNSAEVKRLVFDFLDSIVPATDFQRYFRAHIAPQQEPGRKGNSLLSLLLTELIHAGALTIRRLQSLHGLGFRYIEKDTGLRASYDAVLNMSMPAIITLEVLNWVLGGAEALDRALKKLRHYQRSQEYLARGHREQEHFAGELLPVLDYAGHGFKRHEMYGGEKLEPHIFTNPTTNQKLSYRLYSPSNWQGMYVGRVDLVDGAPYREQNLDFFGLVNQAFAVLVKQGILR